MKILLYIYVVVAAVASFSAWGSAVAGTAGSLLGASMLAWFAGSGLRGSFLAGSTPAKVSGAVLAGLFFFAAHWLASSVPFVVGVFGVQIGGGVWWLIGAAVGFLATSKSDTEPRAE